MFLSLFFTAAANIVWEEREVVVAIMMVMTKVARVTVIDSDKRLTTITAIVIKSVIAAMMETVITAASGIGITHSFIPPFICILYIIFF
ncbi:hypothetical protein SFC55_10105 [Niallia taxi]|uniref:hypothetical protein n=1 Tax=Niallia taxi TaxID=2499688 RepID=UPI00398204FD